MECSGYGECLQTSNICCAKCPNYEYCGIICSTWVFECHKGLCMNCAILFNKRLNFIESLEDCSVCMTNKQEIKFDS